LFLLFFQIRFIMIRKLLCAAGIVLLLYSCSDSSSKISGNDSLVSDSLAVDSTALVPDETLGEIISNISSPIEMASLLSNAGVPYSGKMLRGVTGTDSYSTPFFFATNFGLMDADLCYLNVYGKTGGETLMIPVMKTLADKIGAGNYFDSNLITSLACTKGKEDSLSLVTTTALNNIDNFLVENKKKDILVMAVFGEWLECLWQATEAYKSKPDKLIAERIGEQKSAVEEFGMVLGNIKKDEAMNRISGFIEKLKQNYNEVKITVEVGPPKQIEQNGMLLIVQNETSVVDISGPQIQVISQTIESIRKEVVAQ
jgi:hypothetical protein